MYIQKTRAAIEGEEAGGKKEQQTQLVDVWQKKKNCSF